MTKYIIEYEHEVVITYQAEVDAESEEEAIEKIREGNYSEESEMDYQGMNINIKHIYKEGEDSYEIN